MEDRFAFIIHPIDPKRDVSRKFPLLGKTLPVWLIDYLSLFFPPIYISEITGIRSAATGRGVQGWLLACPLTPRRMMTLPPPVVYRKIIQTGRKAEALGARILGLGAFTSVVGDGGQTISRHLKIPVTTGDSYTVATAVQAIARAAERMDRPLAGETLAVVGGSGSIGSVCARMLAPRVKRVLLLGRNETRLQAVAAEVRAAGCPDVVVSTRMSDLLQAGLIITVTSALETIIEPHHLQRGAVVCDVSRPRDVSRRVAEERQDVLVIEGGMVAVPGQADFGFNFGFPPRMAYACMAETIVLALDGRYENFSIGKMVELSRVLTIDRIAQEHGFSLGGFRSFEKAVTDGDIHRVKAHALAHF